MSPVARAARIGGCLALGAAVGTALLGPLLWDRATKRMVARVTAAAGTASAGVYDPESLGGLPAPVARYFRFALTPGQPLIRGARVEHRGDFRTAPDAAWSPFRSVQHYSVDPPAFVWDARIEMIPLVGVRVRDSYLAGRAAILGRVAALLPVVDRQGGRELASGALHRLLAESAWLPTALLPREGLEWTAMDDTTARVTLRDAGLAVSLDVHFGASGEIVRVEGERYRDVNGAGVLTPFVGTFGDYAEVGGMRIPREGEVAWLLPGGPFSYWRGRAERIEYDLTR
jgi:hypothetical protein